ncbi:hypothetical protein [Kitasatospora sp. NPDC058218]|uniref:hypothetical protein n=1 Tax=Kitasatospora sp. NPDC058218 TaxID=3346385 RepID=UPI0036DC6187
MIPPSRLTGHDLLLLLAKLAETQQPEAVGEAFTRTHPAPTSGRDDWTDDDHASA